ncbi:hypothetical protein [Flavobacterium sp. NKUCC04_CG]|uniref:hypothetical protein n=1 Tax=Flavobacterium sp. NKUCC04_CG TaxID=2842121 RepID=UPI001C5A5F0A|nr:hypothetical protein [Flavobacterium sp. NKUCC04_CG]MBW3520138.1 hypothetical protein [Flavobacterium sp. NKUCC04_CG]
MKNVYTLVVALFAVSAFAQVKVGSNPQTINSNALLEIEGNKGLLMPRMALERTTLSAPLTAHVLGMTVYNTATVNDVKPGFYYNDGAKWSKLITSDDKAVKFFYMPSIAFDTSQDRLAQTKDLYTEYKNQFSLAATGHHVISQGAPAAGIPYFGTATDLYYYITEYDPAVFQNITINANGVMTYDVKAATTDCSLINIVFVVK